MQSSSLAFRRGTLPISLPLVHISANRSVRAHSSSNGNGNGNGLHPATQQRDMAQTKAPINVLGLPLQCCCLTPRTGYFRDGYCRTDQTDQGRHVVCSQVTQQFLEFSRARGNDLMTPMPWYNFPGLKAGDKWCLCAARWREALEAGCAPPVYLQCTHIKALEYVSLEQLKAHALDA